MERALTGSTALSSLVIEVTPAVLREYANRLEACALEAEKRESVLVPLTRSVTLLYRSESQLKRSSPGIMELSLEDSRIPGSHFSETISQVGTTQIP
jgi:hypothetical protein